MRLDPAHVKKLSAAIEQTPDGPDIKLDIAYLSAAFKRLSLWERGVLIQSTMRAASSRHRTLEQRVLLALFVDSGTEA
jgi:hypothetical protein